VNAPFVEPELCPYVNSFSDHTQRNFRCLKNFLLGHAHIKEKIHLSLNTDLLELDNQVCASFDRLTLK